MTNNKENIIKGMTHAEFMSFLYAERDREESLNSYQGWNIWAIIGALITVVCAGYSIICKNLNVIDVLKIGYIISWIVSLALCYRYFVLFVFSFLERKRGVDFLKVKYLKDVAPVSFLIVAIIISVVFAVFFPLFDIENRWSIVSIPWMVVALWYIWSAINICLNKNGIVQSNINGLMSTNIKLEIWTSTVLSVIFSVIWRWSYYYISGSLIGSPDFELAICAIAIIVLLYLLLKIRIDSRKSSRLDVLIDDYLYNDVSKESIYRQIVNYRMGYGVLDVCSHELYVVKKAFDEFDTKKKEIEDVAEILSDENYDGNQLHEYYILIKESNAYLDDCNNRLVALNSKMSKVAVSLPLLGLSEEFGVLLDIEGSLLEREKELKDMIEVALDRMQGWLEKFHCQKWCCWCLNKKCQHRSDSMKLTCRLRLIVTRLFPWAVKYYSVWREKC